MGIFGRDGSITPRPPYGWRKSQEGQTPARPSGSKPPPNLPPPPVPQLVTGMFQRVLTSSRRAGDLLLETLSSDSVHDFSSSSSGRMEEFCEMDLRGEGDKAEGFNPARSPQTSLNHPGPQRRAHPGTYLERLFFSLNPGGPQSGRRSRGERARRGGRGPSLP